MQNPDLVILQHFLRCHYSLVVHRQLTEHELWKVGHVPGDLIDDTYEDSFDLQIQVRIGNGFFLIVGLRRQSLAGIERSTIRVSQLGPAAAQKLLACC